MQITLILINFTVYIRKCKISKLETETILGLLQTIDGNIYESDLDLNQFTKNWFG